MFTGEEIPKIPHEYVNTICAQCGWKEPGLYNNGIMSMTWAELEEFGYVTVKNGSLNATNGNFAMGTLVIGEDMMELQSLSDAAITELWFPCTVTKLRPIHPQFSYDTIAKDCHVTDIVMFCQLDSIAAHAFKYSTTLKHINLPETLKSIESSAFEGCTALEDIHLPDSIEVIGSFAFSGCTSLMHVDLPANLKKTYEQAFSCSGVVSVIFPEGLEAMKDQVFADCKNLEAVVLPAGLKEVVVAIFAGCSSLKSVDMSACEELVDLLYNQFLTCDSLEKLKLPPNLERFGSIQFSGSNSPIPLTELEFPEGVKEVTAQLAESLQSLRLSEQLLSSYRFILKGSICFCLLNRTSKNGQ